MAPIDSEVREILEASMVARIATVSSNGRPHVNPLYFVLDGDDICLGTTTETLAARNVRANAFVQILFEVEGDESAKTLRVSGPATLVHEPAALRQYKRKDARKYFRSPAALWMSITHLRQLFLTSRYLSPAKTGSAHCLIRVEPQTSEILPAATATRQGVAMVVPPASHSSGIGDQ